MIYLIDTHLVLWWAVNDPALSKKARALMADSDNALFVSPVSFWEISIKRSLGKLDFHGGSQDLLRAGPFHPLVLTVEHAWQAGRLPLHHRDPFDRLLIAQARVEGLTLLTHDARLKSYGSSVYLV